MTKYWISCPNPHIWRPPFPGPEIFIYLYMINITCEDNLELMARYPDNHFDLAIVDPPYGLGLDFTTNNGLRSGRNKKTIHEDKDWNDVVPAKIYFDELHRVSKHQIIWGCNYYAQFIPAVGRIIHDKQMSTDGTKINFSAADLASCSLQRRITMFRYRWSGNVQGNTINWKNTGTDKRIHPTQKPVALYKWLLHHYAKPGNKILDTHLGSGSIAIACHDMGFDFTACELDRQYYEAAIKRLSNHRIQQVMQF